MSTENIAPLLDDSVDLSKADRGDTIPEDNAEVTPDGGKAGEENKLPESEVEVEAAKPEAEPEAKPDAEPEEKPRDEQGRFKKDARIPIERHEAVLNREREQREAAERRTKELEDQLATSKVAEDLVEARTKLTEFISQRNKFLADGELEKAGEMDVKIFDFQNEVAAKQAQHQAVVAKEQAKEEMRYDAVIAKLELDYPQINPDDPDFNPDSVQDVRAVMAGLQQTQRLSPSQALAKAVKLVFGAPKADEPPPVDKAAETALRRKEEAVKRNMEVAGKQPAKTGGVGVDHDKAGGSITAANVMKMNQDEFNNLSDAALSKMRGDYIN